MLLVLTVDGGGVTLLTAVVAAAAAAHPPTHHGGEDNLDAVKVGSEVGPCWRHCIAGVAIGGSVAVT